MTLQRNQNETIAKLGMDVLVGEDGKSLTLRASDVRIHVKQGTPSYDKIMGIVSSKMRAQTLINRAGDAELPGRPIIAPDNVFGQTESSAIIGVGEGDGVAIADDGRLMEPQSTHDRPRFATVSWDMATPANTLILGGPGGGKTVLARNIVAWCEYAHRSCFVVTRSSRADDYRASLSNAFKHMRNHDVQTTYIMEFDESMPTFAIAIISAMLAMAPSKHSSVIIIAPDYEMLMPVMPLFSRFAWCGHGSPHIKSGNALLDTVMGMAASIIAKPNGRAVISREGAAPQVIQVLYRDPDSSGRFHL
jgi:hypothetical protein